MSRVGRPWWPAVGLSALFTYNTWALGAVVNGNPEIFRGYLSEFSAFDQPHNLFFRAGDRITALVVGALAIRALLVWPRLRPARPRWWVVAAVGLALFALATFLDSFWSMDCSPTLSAGCRVLEETGGLSRTHYTHTYTSVAAQTGIVASMVAAYLAMRRTGAGGPRWRRAVLIVGFAEVGSLTVMMGMLALAVPGIGYPQTVMVAVASLWFAGVGVALTGLRPSPVPETINDRRDSYAR